MAEQKFNSLSPIGRVKRGLIDGLETVIKSVSGNLDANDAAHYDQAISYLQTNQKEIVRKLNKEISLTTKIIDNINRTITLIKNNQKFITSGLNKIRNELNKFIFEFNDYLQTRNILDQLSLTLNVILHLLSDIENAITFARLKILHNSIIKSDELESILQTILKYYSIDQLIFPYESNNTHRYYDLLEIDAYYSGMKIVFVIHFPIVHPGTFSYYHLFSIPTKNSTTIIPRDSYLVMNENFYQYISLPCTELHPNYYCPNDNLIYGLKNQDCLFQLLQLESTYESCEQTPIQVTQNIIQQIDEAHYIAILPNHTKIHTICERTDFTTLIGNYLITLPIGCQFQTNEYSYINEKIISSGQPMLLPEISVPSKVSVTSIPKISIKNIDLDKIHELQNEQRQLTPLLPVYEDNVSPNYWTIPIYIILMIAGSYFIFRFIQRRRRGPPQPATTEPQPTPRTFFTP